MVKDEKQKLEGQVQKKADKIRLLEVVLQQVRKIQEKKNRSYEDKELKKMESDFAN